MPPQSYPTPDSVYERSPDVLTVDLDGALALVPVAEGVASLTDGLCSLNETGREMWEQLDGRSTLRQMSLAIAERCQVPAAQVERDTLLLIAALLQSGLVRQFLAEEEPPLPAAQVALSGQALADLLEALTQHGSGLRFYARGQSMGPAIRDGDIVTVAPARGWPRRGDVVAFRDPRTRRLLVHRVIASKPNACLIRGDNVCLPDGYVPNQHLLGLVAQVERDGKQVGWPGRGQGGAWTRLRLHCYLALLGARCAALGLAGRVRARLRGG